MTFALRQPEVGGLEELLAAHRRWQREGTPMQLHPGDLGWQWRFGADATAAALRTWSRDGEVLALGFLDDPTGLRLAIDPQAQKDEELAHRLAEDIAQPARGVLRESKAAVEVTKGALVPRAPPCSVPPSRAPRSPRTAGTRWQPGRRTQTRAAYSGTTTRAGRSRRPRSGRPAGEGPACSSLWGVHRDHRGQGHGTAISIAAAIALQQLGSSRALVCTPSANIGAVATYQAAGFEKLDEVPDLARNSSHRLSARARLA